MAETKIKVPSLPATTVLSVGGTDKIIVLVDGKMKLISLASFFVNIKSDVNINPDLGAIGFTINGQAKANLLKIDPVTNRIGLGTAVPTELLHVLGNLQVGGSGSGNAGSFAVSNEVLTVGTTAAAISTNNTFSITNIKTLDTSSSTSTLNLDAPTKANQMRFIILSDTHAGKSSNLNYNLQLTNLIGATSVKFTKLADSISLISVVNGVGFKWVIMGYNGTTVV